MRNSNADESLHFGGKSQWPKHPITATSTSLGRGAHGTDGMSVLAISPTEVIAYIAGHGSVSSSLRRAWIRNESLLLSLGDQSLPKQNEASRNDEDIAVSVGPIA